MQLLNSTYKVASAIGHGLTFAWKMAAGGILVDRVLKEISHDQKRSDSIRKHRMFGGAAFAGLQVVYATWSLSDLPLPPKATLTLTGLPLAAMWVHAAYLRGVYGDPDGIAPTDNTPRRDETLFALRSGSVPSAPVRRADVVYLDDHRRGLARPPRLLLPGSRPDPEPSA